MSKVVEIGPYHSVDPKDWGENYSERRHLERIEWELEHYFGFRFSFREHLTGLIERLGNPEFLRALDGGCGEGAALDQLAELGEKLGVRVITTGITKDPLHKGILIGRGIDEVVIGSVQNFFRADRRKDHFDFILDYAGALSYDEGEGASAEEGQGATIIPIYDRVIASRGTALLCASTIDQSTVGRSRFKVIKGTRSCASVTRAIQDVPYYQLKPWI